MSSNLSLSVEHHPSITIQNADSSCCSPNVAVPPWLKKVELVCRIALAVFAAVKAPILFAISSGVGFVCGIGYAVVKLLQATPMAPEGSEKPVCAQGYMDFLSGMRFPQPIGTLATTAFIAAHMRHDPQFYVPFCGLFVGFWFGKEAVVVTRDLGGRCFNYIETRRQLAQPPQRSCCHANAN